MLGRRDFDPRARPIGILAGSGSVPAEAARAIASRGGCFHIVRIGPDIDGALAGLPVEAFEWGQMGAIFRSFRRAGCRDLLFIGSVRRPDLTRLRPDGGLLWHLPGLLALVFAGGDDGLARSSIRFVERCGFRVVGLADVAPELLISAGPLGGEAPDASGMADILLGSAVIRALGRHDIGQAVVITNGVIEAIEGAEGTDRMLERVAQRRAACHLDTGDRRAPAPRGVLVKRPKPSQEMRIDVPAIGPRTVERAHAAGLAGLAALAGATLVADRTHVIRRSGEARLFVYGFTEGDRGDAADHGARLRAVGTKSRLEPGIVFEAFADGGASGFATTEQDDARRGAAALTSLAALGPRGSAVVVRGYVIGIEPTADTIGLIERTRDIRPWGVGRWRHRAGVVVTGSDGASLPRVIEAARDAKLAAVVVLEGHGRPRVDDVMARDLAGRAARARIALRRARVIDGGGPAVG